MHERERASADERQTKNKSPTDASRGGVCTDACGAPRLRSAVVDPRSAGVGTWGPLMRDEQGARSRQQRDESAKTVMAHGMSNGGVLSEDVGAAHER